MGRDVRQVERIPSPVDLLTSLPPNDNWTAMARRSIARLAAWFLIAEDPQRRLDAQAVVTLAHQASLVRHVFSEPHLDRVLIADEVGLGKTIEAALIIKELLAAQPALRVLYLAPARLVQNVRREFDKLRLGFRMWIAGDERDATLEDPRIIASIHRAAHGGNDDMVLAAPPWDVIVVDECHHLSDWAKGGGKPVQKFALVKKLIERQRPGGRLILMSGTPHQGHRERFENLVHLLRRPEEPDTALRGRVIFRTKDDVHDWEGNPLFPGRQVNPVRVVDLGPRHRAWLQHIHEFYSGAQIGTVTDGAARWQAVGWRAAQALQWATSSIHAGLGFLVRQAIRAGLNLELPGLQAALEAIRPYRLGPPDEPVAALLQRIEREVARQMKREDLEDIEESEEESPDTWRPDPVALSQLLAEGVVLIRESGDEKWKVIYEQVLASAGNEKVVLFAQPIETVTALARYLEKMTGARPALIIGNQSDEERDREVELFWKPNGARYLVSSRAGGEGFNLQVARRLVHVDVPWNPMELEQRIGRIHRFGSRQTVIIDTVVVKDSREVHAYDVARKKLEVIASTLVADDRLDTLFGRVMALVPPAELLDVLGERPLSPLTDDEQRRIAELVTEGFERWKQFHDRFGDQQREIKDLDPGQATWDDFVGFLETHLDAQPLPGFTALRFQLADGEIAQSSYAARVLAIKGAGPYACGDYGGIPVSGENGEHAQQLGLNTTIVTDALRKLGLPADPAGAAHLRWPDDEARPIEAGAQPFAVLVAARQSIRSWQGSLSDVGCSLHIEILAEGRTSIPIDGHRKGPLIRIILKAPIRRDPTSSDALLQQLRDRYPAWIEQLRRPSDADREAKVTNVAIPLLVAVIS